MFVYFVAMYVFRTKYVNLVKNFYIVVEFIIGSRTRTALNQQIFLPFSKARFNLNVQFSHMYVCMYLYTNILIYELIFNFLA